MGATVLSVKGAALPGLLPAGAAALLAAIACWSWLLPQLPTDKAPSAATGTSQLAEVAEAELVEALGTMNLPSAVEAQWRQQARGCGRQLAWVVLAPPPGGAADSVRLRSGTYLSPAFVLAAAPVRVAIPYPAPYEAGRGSLAVLGASHGARVALSPGWDIPAGMAEAVRPVTWTPVAACGRGRG